MKNKVYVLVKNNGKYRICIERKSKLYKDSLEFPTYEKAEQSAKRFCSNLWFSQNNEYITMR